MLTPYFGEFLVVPMPLELSLERCSNGCHYCFSNLNGYKIKGTLQSIYNHITMFSARKDLSSQLLQQGYPICFSNRSDPFCKANSHNSVKFCEVMLEMGIDIAFQTKGGEGVDDVLSFLPPACWYVSITFDDDALAKKIEPGAPTISERFALVARLVEKGHSVSVGINPYVFEWIKDKRSFADRIKQAGAYGVFIEGLHFSREQHSRIKPGAISSAVIERAMGKHANELEMAHYHELCGYCKAAGLKVFSYWNMERTDFWVEYQKRYKCFPIVTDFINYCYDTKKDNDIVTFDEFRNAMTGLPGGRFKIDSYAISINRSFKDKNIPVFGTANDLLKLFWMTPKFNVCPANHPTLAIVAEWNEDLQLYEIDNNINDLMFKSDGWDSYFVNHEGKEI